MNPVECRTWSTAAEAELEEARATLAASESGSALDGGPADRQARKALIAARDEAEFIVAIRVSPPPRRPATTASTPSPEHRAVRSGRSRTQPR